MGAELQESRPMINEKAIRDFVLTLSKEELLAQAFDRFKLLEEIQKLKNKSFLVKTVGGGTRLVYDYNSIQFAITEDIKDLKTYEN